VPRICEDEAAQRGESAVLISTDSQKCDAAVEPSDYVLLLAGTMLPSLLVAWAMGFAVRKHAAQWGLLDVPDEGHKGHDRAVPLGGGVAIAVAVLFTFFCISVLLSVAAGDASFWEPPEIVRKHIPGVMSQLTKLWTILGAAALLMVVGLIDDIRGLSWPIRLGCQLAVAIAVVWRNDWDMSLFLPGEVLSQAIAVLWIVALVNAFNMLDNMDGLSAGVAAICAAALATVLVIAPDPQTGQPQLFVIGFLLVLIGALVGFLIHNTPPAKLFMGDAGSYFIGFCLGIATMQATYTDYHGGRPHAVLAPLCIMAVPLYDMASVIAIRLWNRQSPFRADRRHFSHRLVDARFSKTQAVAIIYMITAATGVAALFLHRVGLTGAVVIFGVVVGALVMLAVVERAARRSSASRPDR